MFSKRKNKRSLLTQFQALATLLGTIIGAGILGLPFAVSQAGILYGVAVLIIVGVMVLFLNLFMGEMVLRVKEPKQLPGYAAYFLGEWAKPVFGLTLLLGVFGAQVAYMIGVGESLTRLFGGSSEYWSIAFVVFFAYPIWRGVQLIKSFELIMMIVILTIMILLGFLSNGFFEVGNLITDYEFSWSKLFIPYGVALFAYGGISSIRPVREILLRREKSMKKIIMIGSLLPVFLYVSFVLMVIGVSGGSITQIATIGLGNIVGSHMIGLGNLFAIFAMSTSFLTMSLALLEVLDYDYGFTKFLAWCTTIGVPLILYIVGVHGFIETLSVVGAIGGGVQGILIVLMYWRSSIRGNRKPEYDIPQHYLIGSLLILMFSLGIILTIYSLM